MEAIQNFIQNNFVTFYIHCTEGGDSGGLVGIDCSTQTMSTEPYHIQFTSVNITPEGFYNFPFDVIGTDYNGYVLVNASNGTLNTFISGGESSESSSIISTEQVHNIGSAVVQGGTSLFGIGLQLLPYIISFFVILIIFLVIRRISNLKNNPYK